MEKSQSLLGRVVTLLETYNCLNLELARTLVMLVEAEVRSQQEKDARLVRDWRKQYLQNPSLSSDTALELQRHDLSQAILRGGRAT